MASNSFGSVFRITTWGESHGKAVGVVLDGCPAGISITDGEINAELERRAPGRSSFTSPRQEQDKAEILSGVFQGQTTGSPVSIIVWNRDADSSKYEPIKDLLRPGHANFTYLQKYGIFDYRGGGRSSARETICRVAAGVLARKLLARHGVEVLAYIRSIGEETADPGDLATIKQRLAASPLFCPDPEAEKRMAKRIEEVKKSGDSLGGVVEMLALGIPVGLGDPVYEKLEANLAKAMMTLPATKGFEIGSGFAAARILGSEHNDLFTTVEGKVQTTTNYAGGTLGGISTGMPLDARVAFKPASSIIRSQKTVNLAGMPSDFQLPEGSRHDPCVAIRAVPVVEAMLALVLADALLMNRLAR